MRNYKHKGLVLPSVTQILKDVSNSSAPLMQWTSNCCIEWIKDNCDYSPYLLDPNKKTLYIVEADTLDNIRFAHKEVSKQALEVGSAIHSSIEAYLTIGGSPNPPETFSVDMRGAFQNAFNAFLKFEKDYELEPIKMEQKLYGNGWAGTCDLIAKITLNDERKVFLLDWKTSKSLFREVRIQTAAYRSLLTNCEGNGAVRLDKATGNYEFKDYSKFYEADLAEWEASVNLYFARHPKVRKKAFKETA